MNLKIGLLAERTGTTVPTIRYYEEIGLLPRANRGHGGQRSYGEEDVGRLTFIRRCRDFGFSVEQVRTLTQLMRDPDRSCVEARDLARQHLSRVRAKLREFKALERSIASFITKCEATCSGGPGSDCVILRDLAEPALRPRAAPRSRARG